MNEYLFGEIQKLDHRVAVLQQAKNGACHRDAMFPMQPEAQDQPVLKVTTRFDERVRSVTALLTTPETREIPFTRVGTDWDLLNWDYTGNWEATLPAYPTGTVVRYSIQVELASGRQVLADDGECFAYQVGRYPLPAWVPGTIAYQIFPDRFSPGSGKTWQPAGTLDDVYGGTLRGTIEHLDHVIDLGFNAIWINPFFPDHTHHGYQASDYFTVNPRLGTLEEMHELVTRANAQGIRLILDFVANHWGSQHPFFIQAQNDAGSEYRDWFYWRDWPHDYETYFDVKGMPKLNVDHPGMRQHLFEAVKFWLVDVGFDGLRLDHANGPAMHFWTELRAYVSQVKPDAWVFGEVVMPPDEHLRYQGRMHGTLDFLLAQALRDTFGHNTMDVQAFDRLIDSLSHFYPPGFSRPLFFDNHDMDRFTWIAKGDTRKLKAVSLCLFTLPDVPFLYYGTEVGVPQLLGSGSPGSIGHAECRRPMIWGDEQDQDLLTYFRWLVHFRKDHPVIWTGARDTLHVDPAANTYVYRIQDEHEILLVAFNLSDKPSTIHLEPSTHSIEHTFALDAWGSAVQVFLAKG